MTRKIVPEFQVSKRKTRAGFVPAHHSDDREVELWTIWARSSDGDDRRANDSDMRRAGYQPKRRKT